MALHDYTQIPQLHAAVLDGIYAAFPDTSLFGDDAGNIVKVTAHGTEVLGYLQNELVGMTLQDLLLPKFRNSFAEYIEENLQEPLNPEETLEFECRIYTKNHSSIPVSIRFFHPCGEDSDMNAPLHFAIVRDLRREKKREQALVADGRIGATGHLSSCVGHDISNPLSVIKLYAEWLITELKEAKTEKVDAPLLSHCLESIQNIEQSADRIESMITKMRNYARSTEQEVRDFEMKDLVTDALYYLDPQIKRAGIRIETNLPQDDCPMTGQPDQIYQSFIHLIKNSCEGLTPDTCSEHPAIKIDIKKMVDEMGDCDVLYECTISDNGCGMTEEVQEQIFAPFFTTKKETQAAGLGLPVVRNVIRRHGGNIQVFSEAGSGTHVTVRIPSSTKPIKPHTVG